MHNGKHARQRKARRWNRSFVLLVSVAALVLGIAGGSLALLLDKTEPVENNFQYGEVSCRVDEQFSGTEKSRVTITNTGNTEAYIRALVLVTWKDAQGNVYGQMPASGDYRISYGSGWTQNGGYLYCNTAVAARSETPVLIESCTAIGEAPAEGYALSVEIIADAVQSRPAAAVQEAWGYTPAVN